MLCSLHEWSSPPLSSRFFLFVLTALSLLPGCSKEKGEKMNYRYMQERLKQEKARAAKVKEEAKSLPGRIRLFLLARLRFCFRVV